MKIYMALTSHGEVILERFRDWFVQHPIHALSSYAEYRKSGKLPDRLASRVGLRSLFLDSGAFSAWTQGVEIDIQEYIQFIKAHQEVLDVYASLDAIGSAVKTIQNQALMEAAGLDPLPCFHYGEPIKYLKRYIAKYEYIAIGIAQKPTCVLFPWLDSLFREHICDERGSPRVKVHGFAVTSPRLVFRYPWYSVDSSTWMVTARTGEIYLPKQTGNYLGMPWKLHVGSRCSEQKQVDGHLRSLSDTSREKAVAFIEGRGFSLGESSFREEAATYSLKEDEVWAGKAKGGRRPVELLKSLGVVNQTAIRALVNADYFLEVAGLLPWPGKLSSKIMRKRRGLLCK